MKIKLALLTATAAVFAASSANAAELVTNGGFETFTIGPNSLDSFAGWTTIGNHMHVNIPRTGDGNVGFGNTDSQFDTLSQTLATVAGTAYSFSFYVSNPDADIDEAFEVFFGAAQVFNLATIRLASPFDYTRFSYNVVATSNSTTISFRGFDGPAHIELDDVSVDGVLGAVPEPATWAMMLVGFGMMGATMRYRRCSTTTVYA